MNGGFAKDFYTKGNSVKRSGRFSEPPNSEKRKVAVFIPFPKISSYCVRATPIIEISLAKTGAHGRSLKCNS